MAPVDYSKWDALELSDDSDIEVHPNVDKRSFIRAKQNQIHQERDQRKHEITTLKYERIINDGLLTRIDNLLNALKAHASSANDSNTDELVLQSLIESAGDRAQDQPPPPPPGVHTKIKERPTYSKMMAGLVDDVKKAVEGRKEPEKKFLNYVELIGAEKKKVLDLQQKLLVRLAELEKLEKSKITSESIKFGFNSSHVAKSNPTATSSTSTSVELLNPSSATKNVTEVADSGAEADVEDETEEGSVLRATPLGKAFGKIKPSDYRASLEFISKNPSVLAERETDGLLLQAFDDESAGDSDSARSCVHQALLLQYCRSLGRDGVALFFKRITTQDHQARKVFYDDVNSTYARLRDRAVEMAKETAEDEGTGVEQIQLRAVHPGQKIYIGIPPADDPDHAEARKVYDAFPPGLQRALESGGLDELNKVLGHMSVDDAEEVIGQLGEYGMLNMEEGVVDTTTEEGKAMMKQIEESSRLADEKTLDRTEEEVGDDQGLAVDKVD